MRQSKCGKRPAQGSRYNIYIIDVSGKGVCIYIYVEEEEEEESYNVERDKFKTKNLFQN